MATPRNLIGPQLRQLRNQRGLSQQDLAALFQRRGWDVSRGIIARIEGQVRWIADFELIFIAQALGKSVEDILSRKGISNEASKLVRLLQRGID